MDWVYEDVLPQIRETGGYNPKSKTTLEILFDTVKELVDINHKVEDHEDRIINLEGGKVSKGYYTVKRFACKHGFIVGKPGDWKMLGKKCTAACKANGIRIERQLDDNYDEVNAYPEHILEDVFMIEGVQRRSKAG